MRACDRDTLKDKVGKMESLKFLPKEQVRLKKYKRQDNTITDEMAAIFAERDRDANEVNMTVPTFLYYYHSGYKQAWERKEWHCPSMKREFSDYMDEAIGKGF